MSHTPDPHLREAPPRKWLLVLVLISTMISPGCIYRKVAKVNLAKTPDSRCHQEYCNKDCTTTVDLRCVPPPIPHVPDPQLPVHKVPLRLGIREASLMAINNNEVARVQATDRDVIGVGTIYDPRIANAERLAELGIFDTLIGGNILLPHERNPPGLSYNGFAVRPTRLDRGDVDISISQLMRRGGTIGLNHFVDYLFVPGSGGINPQYQSYLEASLTQPLLRGFGEVVTTAPIGIKASEANQSVWEFKRKMIEMVRDVEVAYWQLGAAQQRVKLIDETLPILQDMTDKLERRARADRATQAQVARVKSAYFQVLERRIDAVRIAKEKEQLLRNLLGMPPADGQYLLLTDDPFLAPIRFDWDELVQVAVERRPEVVRQRLAVHIANLEWTLANNAVLPQVDIFTSARMAGVDDELGSSWGMMFSAAHTSWNAGILFEVPLQRTRERNDLRGAQLNAARERALLSQLAHQVVHELANTLRDISMVLEQYDVANNRLNYNKQWLKAAAASFDTPADAENYDQTFDRYLQATQTHLQAGERVVRLAELYNSALVMLEEDKGTLLETLGLYVAGDPTEKANEKTMPEGEDGKKIEQIDPQSGLGRVHVSPEFVNKGQPATAMPDGPPPVDVSHEYAPQPVVIPGPHPTAPAAPAAPAQGPPPVHVSPGAVSQQTLPDPNTASAASAAVAAASTPAAPYLPPTSFRENGHAGPVSRLASTANPQGPPPVHVAPEALEQQVPPASNSTPVANLLLGPPPVHVSPEALQAAALQEVSLGGDVRQQPEVAPSARNVTPTASPQSPPPVHVSPEAYPQPEVSTPARNMTPTADPQGPPPVHVSPEAYPQPEVAPVSNWTPTASPQGPPPVHVSPEGIDYQTRILDAIGQPATWNAESR